MPTSVSGRNDGGLGGSLESRLEFLQKCHELLVAERRPGLPDSLPWRFLSWSSKRQVAAPSPLAANSNEYFFDGSPPRTVILTDSERRLVSSASARDNRSLSDICGCAHGWLRLVGWGHGCLYAGAASCDSRSQNGRHNRDTTSVLSSITVPVSTGLRFGHTSSSEYSSGCPSRCPNSCEATSPESSVCQRLRLLHRRRVSRGPSGADLRTSTAPRTSTRTRRCIPAARNMQTCSSICLRFRASSGP